MKELDPVFEGSHFRRITILTGSGISAESGIPTFRGAGGLWNSFRAEQLATPQAFASDPATVWAWYEWRRTLVREATPNAAHEALARLEADPRFETVIVTQNVDGLHQRAGSRNVLELHGSLFRVRCVREGRTLPASGPFPVTPPHCICGGLLRPDVVWFGEPLDPDIWTRASDAVEEADLVLLIGTSSAVYPAAGLIDMAGGRTIEINPEVTPATARCQLSLPLKATEGVPAIIDRLMGVRS